MSLFECADNTTLQVTMYLLFTAWVSIALEALDVIV